MSVCASAVVGRPLLHLHQAFPWSGGGANQTITCLWKTTKYLIETSTTPLGQTLFVQVDGASDNVNQTVLRFLAWLCQQGVCRTVSVCRTPLEELERSSFHVLPVVGDLQVYLTRLPVGHTHEDVDQRFSVTSRVRKPVALPIPDYQSSCGTLSGVELSLDASQLQRLRVSDRVTPPEFEWAVRSAFRDVWRDSECKVCLYL